MYDLHSPRVPTQDETICLMRKAVAMVPRENLWTNPDCGLKTRGWPETKAALTSMVGRRRYCVRRWCRGEICYGPRSP